jgi:hypothetical protein
VQAIVLAKDDLETARRGTGPRSNLPDAIDNPSYQTL